MSRTTLLSVTGVLLLAVSFIGCASRVRSEGGQPEARAVGTRPAMADRVAMCMRVPLAFEENRGQAAPEVKFRARGHGYCLNLTANEAVVRLQKPLSTPQLVNRAVRSKMQAYCQAMANRWLKQGAWASPKLATATVTIKLAGAKPDAQCMGLDRLASYSNYLIGNDPAKWCRSVPNFGRVMYRGVYDGIDVVYYGNQQQLEYDFNVAAGADPGQIRFGFTGLDRLELADNGDLVLHTGQEQFSQRKPIAYQLIDGRKREVACAYERVSDREVNVKLGSYDRRMPLVIDPTISYSTFIGGTGFDMPFEIAADEDGNAYIAGTTPSTDFPTTGGASQGAMAGPGHQAGDPLPIVGGDAFVAKLNSAGSTLLWATYMGGSQCDYGRGIAVDDAHYVYVSGETESTDFPATAGSVQTTLSGGSNSDGFLTRLDPEGTHPMYSTYLGGSNFDEAFRVAVDANHDVYVAGNTMSTDGIFVPGNLNGANATIAGGVDAFLAKINAAGNAVTYLTYIGGTGTETAYAVAVDNAGNAYVAGETMSGTGFQINKGFQTSYHDATDGFLVRLNTTVMGAGSLVYSTFLGGGDYDSVMGVAADNTGHAYLVGATRSTTDFPTQNAQQGTYGGGFVDGFYTKLDTNQSGGASLLYSTYIGGSGADGARGVAVDANSNVYICGGTSSANLPVVNAMTGQDTFSSGGGGVTFYLYDQSLFGLDILGPDGSPEGLDGWVGKWTAAGTPEWVSYLGGDGDDGCMGIALDANANVYVTGLTEAHGADGFPNTGGNAPLSGAIAGSHDAFIVRIGDTADADGDGVPGSTDNCPTIANADQANADGDAAGDACDACPNDANKTAAGICGCGVADADADGDGTADCLDGCPNDANKTAAGECGCGVAETAGCGAEEPSGVEEVIVTTTRTTHSLPYCGNIGLAPLGMLLAAFLVRCGCGRRYDRN